MSPCSSPARPCATVASPAVPQALNEELTQERQTREGVEKALTKKTQEMMALEAIRKSLQQQLDRMAADKAAALSKAAAKIKNLEAEHERKTEMAEVRGVGWGSGDAVGGAPTGDTRSL